MRVTEDAAVNDSRVPHPDSRAFWRWVLASVRPVAGWLLVGVGALVLLMGWIGVSREVLVSKQLPYLVSGGLGGLGTIIIGARLLVSEDLRSYDVRLQRMEHLVDDLHELLLVERSAPEQTSTEQTAPTSPSPSPNGSRVVVLETGTSFHRPDCRLVRDKDGSEMVTRAMAAERGRKPCGVCHSPARAAAAPIEQ